IPSGRRLSSRALPLLVSAHTGSAAFYDTRMGWLDPDRKLWVRGSGLGHDCSSEVHGGCEITILDLTVDPVGVTFVGTPGRGHLVAAPDAAFFAQSTSGHYGLHLFAPDGRVFLTTGVFEEGPFAFTPDGRFACAARGCVTLRCTVGAHSQPIDHPACRPMRREGFSIDAELAGLVRSR